MSDVKSTKVEEYSLVDFVMKIQQGIRDGYEVNDTSDDAPIQIGGAFHVIMRECVKPVKVVGKAVFEASLDTTKLQEQLKSGGEIEQLLVDSLIVEEKVDKEIPIPEPESTLDESLPKDEQVTQTPIKATQTNKRGRNGKSNS